MLINITDTNAQFEYDLDTRIIQNPKAQLSLRVRLAQERAKKAVQKWLMFYQ